MHINLSPISRHLLSLQVKQSGVFTLPLFALNGVMLAKAKIVTERCDRDVSIRIEMGASVNTLTLPCRKDNADHVAQFLEDLANGVERGQQV